MFIFFLFQQGTGLLQIPDLLLDALMY
jgi:hypothetical protein